MTAMIAIVNYTNHFATEVGAVLEALVLFWFCSPLSFRRLDTLPLFFWPRSRLKGEGSPSQRQNISPIPARFAQSKPMEERVWNLVSHVLVLTALVLLHCQHYRFLLQCPLLTAIVLFYICFVHQTSLKNGLVLSVVFCIVGEISHMFCDDVIRNWLIADLLHTGDGVRENYFNIILYTLCLLGLLRLLKGILFRNDRARLRWREIMVPFLSIIPFFYMRAYQYQIIPSEGGIDRQVYLAMILMAILSLAMILINEYSLYDRIDRSEMEKMELLLRQQKEYYRLQDETMRAVNRNYHDLKHVLTLLEQTAAPIEGAFEESSADETGKSRPKRQNTEAYAAKSADAKDIFGNSGDKNIRAYVGEYVERMKKEITPFENLQPTGNETLDILLSQKLQECSRKGLRALTCVDGRAFAFLNPLDICVLFGNAFDNAIEATQKVAEEAKREICVKAGAKSGQIFLRFENFYEGGTPDLKTSKADKTMHGYGIRNMESVAEKYGGVVTCEAADGYFILTIMIPVPTAGAD